MVVLKILFLTIKLKKGRFRRLTGDILGGSLCYFYKNPHSCLLISTNQDHNTKLNR